MKHSSILRTTILLTAIALPAVSCFAQQEVAPTWHDPWAVTPPAAAQPDATAANQAKPKQPSAQTKLAAEHARHVRKAQPPASAHVEKTDAKDTRAAGSL